MDRQYQNPFAVQTPEDINASDVVNLFVEEDTDFHKIPNPGHTFLNGARGSGKSMIFRYLEPDCQVLKLSRPVGELPYFAVYASIKNTSLNLTELARLENKHASLILNEHLLASYLAVKIFSSLVKAGIEDEKGTYAAAFRSFYTGEFHKLLKRAGMYDDLPGLADTASLRECFSPVMGLLESVHLDTVSYLRRVSYKEEVVSYRGPLFGYLDFLLPLLKGVKCLPFMPRGPIFLLLDDADNLNLTQTTVLNTWVSHRTGADVSLKISTQLTYKTYRSVAGGRIDCPHDYSEINISDIYTSQKNNYMNRVRKIVEKRLAMHGCATDPEAMFPPDEEQEEKIRKIGDERRAKWETEGRGNRPSDDVVRYARPDYIASLKGTSKSGSTYSYAGFEQLVHLSSGVVRYFLEAASQMYGHECGHGKDARVDRISPRTQNEVVRQLANEFLYGEFEKMTKDVPEETQKLDIPKKLRNLITALGGMFHLALLDKGASERRYISFAFSDDPDREILDVLDLGIRFGYFHRSTIGTKEGTGRTPLYILSRRLAPHFLLDPTGFAAHKSATSNRIREAMRAPKRFLGRLESQGIDKYLEDVQLELYGEK